MAAGTPLLRKFARKGLTLEGKGPQLLAAAAAVLAAGAVAISSPAEASPQLTGSAKSERLNIKAMLPHLASPVRDMVANMPEEERPLLKQPIAHYSTILHAMRAQVDAEYPGRIVIVDRSTDPQSEIKRIAGQLQTPAGRLPVQDFFGGGLPGPHTYLPKDDRQAALVFGGDAFMSADMLLQRGLVKSNLGSITDQAAHCFILWHEIGHAILGLNEAQAESFAALKTLLETGDVKEIELFAAMRELNEWFSPPKEPHMISLALRDVLDRFSAGEYGPAGRYHSLKSIAAMVRQLPEPDFAPFTTVRDAFAKADVHPFRPYFVPVREGLVSTDILSWMRSAPQVPEFKRIIDLIDYVQADPGARKLPPRFVPDPDRTKLELGKLAAAGDPIARKLAIALGAKPASTNQPILADAGLRSASEVRGKLIEFNRSSAVVKFDLDITEFVVRDARTKRPVLAADANKGLLKTYPSYSTSVSFDRPHP